MTPVEEDAVEAADDFEEGARVMVADDDVFGAEAVNVADETLGAGLLLSLAKMQPVLFMSAAM